MAEKSRETLRQEVIDHPEGAERNGTGPGEAQSLAAALNHSAFNMANALGPWLGGMAIAAGFGWTSTGWVGSALALGGLAVWAISRALQEKAQATDHRRIATPSQASS